MEAASASTSVSDIRHFIEPANTLKNLESKQLLFLGSALCLVGVMWLAVAIALYGVATDYHTSVLYEARWLLSTVLLSGVLCFLLACLKLEAMYISCAITALYSCASTVVVLLVYSINIHRTLNVQHLPTLPGSIKGQTMKLQYVKLCASMAVICIFGLLLTILLLWRMYNVSQWHFAYVTIQRSLSRYFISSGMVQFALGLFSIYVASQIISLRFSYVHTYMIQELFCSLILITVTSMQIFLIFRPNRILLKVLLFMYICQFVQETFYTWNSYYISLYIHSSKVKIAINLDYDQVIMTLNFTVHFIRSVICVYSAHRILAVLQISFEWLLFRIHRSKMLQKILAFLACGNLLLSTAHVLMDIIYTSQIHIYRTLIAFTGISVLYLSLIGVCLSVYLRYKQNIALALAFVFVLLSATVSVHAIYVYLDTSFKKVLLMHLNTLGKDQWQPSIMHFIEVLLAYVEVIFSLFGGILLLRLLHLGSPHDRRESRLDAYLRWLWRCGWAIAALTSTAAIINITVREEWQAFDNTIAYNVLDIISMYVLAVLQLFVSCPGNNHFCFTLAVLFFLLLFETFTTYNYLSTYTNYMQLLIVLNKLLSKALAGKRDNDISLVLPLSQVDPLIVNHAIQIFQWFLTVISLLLAASCLEELKEQRKRRSSDVTMNASPGLGSISTVRAGDQSEVKITYESDEDIFQGSAFP
ncbi:unnamed protein product [Soboliphyme baturini]|uniref:RING-type domain-containing protein n=1 Tax=Soboliphyme baturini TaxID=241478 RepID=A0A183J2S3_9BILA|nr:unnamed protein product [Soboliphyme baturini]